MVAVDLGTVRNNVQRNVSDGESALVRGVVVALGAAAVVAQPNVVQLSVQARHGQIVVDDRRHVH